MNRTVEDLRFANRTGLCPVCRMRPRGVWQDTGAKRVTCGSMSCYTRWLPTPRDHSYETPTPVAQNAEIEW